MTILILVLSCTASLGVAGSVRAGFAGVVRHDDALIANVTLRAKLLDDEETGLRGYLLVRQPLFLQPYRAALARLPAARSASLRLARGDPGEIRLLNALSRGAGRWERWARSMLAAPPARATPARLEAQMLTGKRLFDAYRRASDAILQRLFAHRVATLTAANSTVRTMTILLAALFFLAVLGALVAGLWTLRSLQRPLMRLAWLADRIAEGDLTAGAHVDPIREFGSLVSAMERMRREIRGQRNLSTMLAACLRPDDVYRTFTEALRQHVHADRLSVSKVGPGPHEMTSVFVAGDGTEGLPEGTTTSLAGSIASRAYQTGRPVLRADLAALPPADLFDDERKALAAGIRSLAIIPLMVHGRVLATLNLGSRQAAGYSEQALGPILTLAPMVASAIENAQLYESLSDAKRQLESQRDLEYGRARRDALTNLGNRLRLEEDLSVLHARAQRYGHTYSLVLCDVDYFKAYNDHYGHPAGDTVLATVAETLTTSVRRGDAVYRYGGEEFLILLPEQEEEEAYAAAERLRAAVQARLLPHEARPDLDIVTISAGVATLHGASLPEIRDVIAEADAALYHAKAAGRNLVVAGAGAGLRVLKTRERARTSTA